MRQVCANLSANRDLKVVVMVEVLSSSLLSSIQLQPMQRDSMLLSLLTIRCVVMMAMMLAAWAATRDMSEESPDRADATRATTAPSETTTTSDNGVASERPSDLIGGGYFKFDEVASDIGLRDLPEEAPSNIGAFVGGASVGDYDGDGKLDLFLTNFSISDRLFRATPEGNFVDVTADSGLIVRTGSPADGVGSAASVWADIDGDGALDLFVGGVGDQANQLYVNDGAGGFTEEAERRGVADMFTVTKSQPFAAHTVLGSAFADWDKDGDLDLMSAHWQPFCIFILQATTHTWINNGKVVVAINFSISYLPSTF